jgi:HK97 family phage major capsid protein
MTPEEIKAALKQPIDMAVKEIGDKMELSVKEAKEVAATELKKEAEALRLEVKEVNEKFDAFKKEMGKKKPGAEAPIGFHKAFGDLLEEKYDSIKEVRKGKGFADEMSMKTVGTMTTTANLTAGVVVTSYQPGMAMLPFPKVNFTDLVKTVSSATGSYTIYSQDGEGEGSISEQTVPADPKTQIDFDVKGTVYTANYIAGYVRIAKQMLQDLPFLQSYLPQMLMRKFLKTESTILQAQLVTKATAYSASTGIPYIAQMINAQAQLEANDFTATAFVVSPADWATLLQYRATGSGQYTYPGSLVVSPNGVLMLNGVPVYKASFMTTGQYWVGDWDYASKIVADGLKVEFFEQDSDNVQKNLITVRIESREVLGVDLGSAFRYGTFVAQS